MKLRMVCMCLLIGIAAHDANAQKKNKSTVPRDSITSLYAYNGTVTNIEGDLDALKERLDRWIAQNYNFDTDEHASLKIDEDGDTYTVHARAQMEGRARRFIEYDLTADLRNTRYRYKLTNLRYIVSGNYALEDKRATSNKKDLQEINGMMSRVLASLKAAMTDNW